MSMIERTSLITTDKEFNIKRIDCLEKFPINATGNRGVFKKVKIVYIMIARLWDLL